MARRVVSVISSAPRLLRTSEPVLEANAFAVAEDIDLQLVLLGAGVELAADASGDDRAELAGTALGADAPGQDLRALIESGVAVHVESDSLAAHGLSADELVAGVRPATTEEVTELLRAAEAVLTW